MHLVPNFVNFVSCDPEKFQSLSQPTTADQYYRYFVHSLWIISTNIALVDFSIPSHVTKKIRSNVTN